MFVTRLISGIVLVIIALATIITGGPVLFATIMVVSLIGMSELYKVAGVNAKEEKLSLLSAAGYLGIIGYDLLMFFGKEEFFLIEIIGSLILIMFVYVFTYPKYHANQIMAAMFGILYVGVMLSYIYQTRCLTNGAFLVWLIFLCSWGCDTCAYCVGMLIGKHKMSPKLSPKKSVEGAFGGVIGAILLGVIYALATARFQQGAENLTVTYGIICGAGALISMVGDLAASAIKRNHEIKDYGTLIPGHGGILDRFDSVIFTAPVIYFLAVVLSH